MWFLPVLLQQLMALALVSAQQDSQYLEVRYVTLRSVCAAFMCVPLVLFECPRGGHDRQV